MRNVHLSIRHSPVQRREKVAEGGLPARMRTSWLSEVGDARQPYDGLVLADRYLGDANGQNPRKWPDARRKSGSDGTTTTRTSPCTARRGRARTTTRTSRPSRTIRAPWNGWKRICRSRSRPVISTRTVIFPAIAEKRAGGGVHEHARSPPRAWGAPGDRPTPEARFGSAWSASAGVTAP